MYRVKREGTPKPIKIIIKGHMTANTQLCIAVLSKR